MTTNALSNTMLVSRCHAGDRDALDALIRRNERKAYQFAFRLTRNRDEASDIVADAFVRVTRNIHKFKNEAAFTTWLHRIITNCFLDMRKKVSARPLVSLDYITDDSELHEREIESPEMSPHEIAENNLRAAIIADSQLHIPAGQTEIMRLYHTDLLSYEQIAARLRTPMGTVKSRLHRARMSVREQLVNEFDLFGVSRPVMEASEASN